MTSLQIAAHLQASKRFMECEALLEIAYQLAVLNERETTRNANAISDSYRLGAQREKQKSFLIFSRIAEVIESRRADPQRFENGMTPDHRALLTILDKIQTALETANETPGSREAPPEVKEK